VNFSGVIHSDIPTNNCVYSPNRRSNFRIGVVWAPAGIGAVRAAEDRAFFSEHVNSVAEEAIQFRMLRRKGAKRPNKRSN
jgi:hypothetical protein